MLKLSLYENLADVVAERALHVLKDGGIVAYPTESFYALGVLALNKNAVKRLYELKKRPLQRPMPVIVGSNDVLKSIVKSIPSQAEILMEKFWPGALTIVFDAIDGLPEILTTNTGKIAVRIPGDSFALSLAKVANFPITATSANISGKPPAQSSEEVLNYFGENIDLVVNGPKTPGGKPSTIVDVTVMPFKVLREGRVLVNNE